MENELRRARAQIALGTLDATKADARYGLVQWIDALNGQGGGRAPNGAAAYGSVADTGGVVGIAVEGDFASDDLVVTLTRPQYADFEVAEVHSVRLQDI